MISSSRGMSSAATKRLADVVVLGGGMVGSSLACAMAGSPYFAGKKICLLEGAPKKPYTKSPNYSNRVIAMNLRITLGWYSPNHRLIIIFWPLSFRDYFMFLRQILGEMVNLKQVNLPNQIVNLPKSQFGHKMTKRAFDIFGKLTFLKLTDSARACIIKLIILRIFVISKSVCLWQACPA